MPRRARAQEPMKPHEAKERLFGLLYGQGAPVRSGEYDASWATRAQVDRLGPLLGALVHSTGRVTITSTEDYDIYRVALEARPDERALAPDEVRRVALSLSPSQADFLRAAQGAGDDGVPHPVDSRTRTAKNLERRGLVWKDVPDRFEPGYGGDVWRLTDAGWRVVERLER